jgi:hypothetical protein
MSIRSHACKKGRHPCALKIHYSLICSAMVIKVFVMVMIVMATCVVCCVRDVGCVRARVSVRTDTLGSERG